MWNEGDNKDCSSQQNVSLRHHDVGFMKAKPATVVFLKAPDLEKGNINLGDMAQDTSGSQAIPLFPVFWKEKQESKHVHWHLCYQSSSPHACITTSAPRLGKVR